MLVKHIASLVNISIFFEKYGVLSLAFSHNNLDLCLQKIPSSFATSCVSNKIPAFSTYWSPVNSPSLFKHLQFPSAHHPSFSPYCQKNYIPLVTCRIIHSQGVYLLEKNPIIILSTRGSLLTSTILSRTWNTACFPFNFHIATQLGSDLR